MSPDPWPEAGALDAALSPPVAIGGIGGSGTRVVAEVLRRVGFFLGSDLNGANDNLWFTFLFKRRAALAANPSELRTLVTVFLDAMQGRPPSAPLLPHLEELAREDRPLMPQAWLQERLASLLSSSRDQPGSSERWGWKEPNTHIFLPALAPLVPGLRYVHVARNGLDMCLSNNQQQVELWGPHLLAEEDLDGTARMRLRYWCEVHRRILGFMALAPGRALLLRFEALCADPRAELTRLLDFLEIPVPPELLEVLCELVVPPASIGRFRSHELTGLDPEDVDYVRSLGFDVPP